MRRRALTLSWALAAATVAAQDTLRFEVASVRPNTGSDQNPSASPHPPDGLTYVNFPLYQMILNAYSVRTFQVAGMPGWTMDARYDITARASGPITSEQRLLMLRSLLEERFNLKTRLETREQPVYVLTRARADEALGPGLKPRPECTAAATPCEAAGTGARAAGYIRSQAFPMSQVQRMLSIVLERVVFDETRIDGVFDVDVSWRPENAPADNPLPSLFTAVEERLGLKLTPQRRMVDMLVIESLDRATPQ